MKWYYYIFLFYVSFLVEQGVFELIHWFECKKAKGQCENCNDWSCCRKHILFDIKKKSDKL